MATHSTILAWRTPGMGEPGGLLSMGSHSFVLSFLHTFFDHSLIKFSIGLPWWLSGEEPACQYRRRRFDPWVGQIPWRRKWQPTPLFLPGESQGQRGLVGYSP